MPGFISKILERIAPREHVDSGVLEAFQQALGLNGQVHLMTMDGESGDVRTWRADLESVGQDSFLASEPSLGAELLAPQLEDVFEVAVLTRQGRQCGMACCIGRELIPSGGRVPMPGYRFAYPPSLVANERRKSHRVPVGFDMAPLARIFDGRSSGPVEANIMDLSIGGLQVRCHSFPSRFAAGQTVDMEINLPEPVGSMLAPVRIASVRPDTSGQQDRIGVAFVQPIEGMATLVRNIDLRRARRRRSEQGLQEA